jgi:hypothetical protein
VEIPTPTLPDTTIPGGDQAAAPPSIEIRRAGRRMRATLTLACSSACRGTAKLTVDRRTARRADIASRRTIGRAPLALGAAGQKTFRVRLSEVARRALRRAEVRSLRATLAVKVTDVGGRTQSVRQTVRLLR